MNSSTDLAIHRADSSDAEAIRRHLHEANSEFHDSTPTPLQPRIADLGGPQASGPSLS